MDKLTRNDDVQCMSGADWGACAPSRRLILEDDFQHVVNQRDELATAIGEALVNAGIVSTGFAMTGPELTMGLDNLVDHYKQLVAASVAAQPDEQTVQGQTA